MAKPKKGISKGQQELRKELGKLASLILKEKGYKADGTIRKQNGKWLLT